MNGDVKYVFLNLLIDYVNQDDIYKLSKINKEFHETFLCCIKCETIFDLMKYNVYYLEKLLLLKKINLEMISQILLINNISIFTSFTGIFLYRIWEYLFTNNLKFKCENPILKGSEDKGIPFKITKNLRSTFVYDDTYNINYNNIIYHLTKHILSHMRLSIIINEKFILKCFESKKLTKILTFIHINKKFYNISINEGKYNIEDLYIYLSIDKDNFEILLYMISKIKKKHLEYALKYGNMNLLLVLAKERKQIENFEQCLKEIKGESSKLNDKQVTFFKFIKL